MHRRKFLTATAAVAAGSTLPSCVEEIATGSVPNIQSAKTYEWIMVTTWPPGFPILHEACEKLAALISTMSGGQLKIKVFGAGELIPAFECFEAVSLGTAAIASGASYYWAGKIPAAQFFASLPFGLNAQGMNAWLLQAGGLDLWRKAYAPFNLVPFPGGNTGVQMAGWFNREINEINDLQGLKMRIPGLGGKVFEAAGGTTLLSPGNELYTNLERGVIDATEWIGPYHDYLMGFHEVANYYYAPGWHEPGTVLEMIVHKPTLEQLPDSLQAIVQTAILYINDWTLQAFESRNGEYINKLQDYGTEIRLLPKDYLDALRPIAHQVVSDLAASDAQAQKVYASYEAFAKTYHDWTSRSEQAYWKQLIT